jgi:hypothetical protein
MYDYDYHIFKVANNGNILKITHPEYFNHYGYFDNLDELESGLWEQSQINEEVYIYTKNNELRATEHYYHDTTIVTALAKYRVEEEFDIEFCDGDGVDDAYCSVDSDGKSIDGEGKDEIVSVPIKQVLNDDGTSDSVLTDVFKVVRTRTITMIGNGVEMGTRNTIWLAKGLGVVKDKLEIRWSEPFWETEDTGWEEYTRLELNALRSHDPRLFRKIFHPLKVIKLNQLGNESKLENDPYRPSPTFGLHRLRYSIEN